MSRALPPDDAPIPQMLFPCADEICAEQSSSQPDEMKWVPEWNGWYCIRCIDWAVQSGEEITTGPTLAEWLKQKGIVK